MGRHNYRELKRVGLLVLVVSACAGFSCEREDSDVAVTRTFAEPAELTKITDSRITESSGVAPSRLADGVYFTHNDSGDSARFFRFDTKGKVLGVYDVRNAKAIDWEDMASAKYGSRSYIYCGDIGDNAGRRSTITVYRVPEPTGGSRSVTADRTYTLTYPDRPHNAETLLVNPQNGDLTIVTKASKSPSQVFLLKNPGRSGSFKLERLGELKLGGSISQTRLITGGAYSPDGKYVMLRTYLQGYEFAVGADGKWVDSAPVDVKLPFDFQGEAVTYSRDGDSLITTSEGSPCPVGVVKIQR